jgi:predicted RNA binding protein YcfA (HicA-like mRNA interferase family)
MPQKIRELKAQLRRAGFTVQSGKGSHTIWRHSRLPGERVVLSGNDGRDARSYQVDGVDTALDALRAAEERERP